MKRLIYSTLFLSFLSVISCKPEEDHPISRKDADATVRTYIKNEIHDVYLLYLNPDTLSYEISVVDWSEDTMHGINSFVYFIDEAPLANWEHPCRYIWISKENGSITNVYHRSSPPDGGGWILLER